MPAPPHYKACIQSTTTLPRSIQNLASMYESFCPKGKDTKILVYLETVTRAINATQDQNAVV